MVVRQTKGLGLLWLLYLCGMVTLHPTYLLSSFCCSATQNPDPFMDASRSVTHQHPKAILSRELHQGNALIDWAALECFGASKTSLPMKYGIFNGTSSLRSLSDDERRLLSKESHFSTSQKSVDPVYSRAISLLFLANENLEVAHEVLLGVTPQNLDEAEYAATHPGKTSWSQDHPLTDSADRIHALIHRLEGSAIGEGKHSGYENAKYWILGGPKCLDKPADLRVKKILETYAPKIAPRCVANHNLLGRSESTTEHHVPIGGGRTRTVKLDLCEGEWDDLSFIELCRLRECGNILSEEECIEIVALQQIELFSLLQSELEEAGLLGGGPVT